MTEITPIGISRADVLKRAEECVCGHREQDYGSPEDNFKVIADLWNGYLQLDPEGKQINSKDVAMMMALLKVARARSEFATDDCFIDLAGYAACAGEIVSRNR